MASSTDDRALGACEVGQAPEVVNAMRATGFDGSSTVIGHGADLATLKPLDMDGCRTSLNLP